MTAMVVQASGRMQKLIGWALVLGSAMVWANVIFAVLIAKVIPETGVELLDAVKHDRYYCYLVPLLLPTLVIFRYWSWLSMQFFQHC